MTLLEVRNLKVHFLKKRQEKQTAVSGIDFTIQAGETVALIGETGSGKSVAAKALARLFAPNTVSLEGSILFQGKDLLLYSEKELRAIRGKEIGMVFQDPMTFLNPTLSVGYQIIEALRQSNPQISYLEAELKALSLLKKMGIQDAKERFSSYPHTLSGGMRQRILITMALITNPKLLIADEPTTALDVTIQAEILHLLKIRQQETGMSILFITHDLSLVAGFCDKILVLYEGKIVEQASTESIFTNPKHPYTKRLLEAALLLEAEKS